MYGEPRNHPAIYVSWNTFGLILMLLVSLVIFLLLLVRLFIFLKVCYEKLKDFLCALQSYVQHFIVALQKRIDRRQPTCEIQTLESFEEGMFCVENATGQSCSFSRNSYVEESNHEKPMSDLRISESIGGILSNVGTISDQICPCSRNSLAYEIDNERACHCCTKRPELRKRRLKTMHHYHYEETWRMYYDIETNGKEICQSLDKDSIEAEDISSQAIYNSRILHEKFYEEAWCMYYAIETNGTETCPSLDKDSFEAEDISSQAIYNSIILHEQCYEEAWCIYYGIETNGTETCPSLDKDSIEAEDISSQAIYNSRIVYEQCYEEAWCMYYGIETNGTETCPSLDKDSIEAEDISSQAIYNSRIVYEQCYEEAWCMYYGIETNGTETCPSLDKDSFEAEDISSQAIYNSRIVHDQCYEEAWCMYYGIETNGTETCLSLDKDSNEAEDISSQTFYNSRILYHPHHEKALRLHYSIQTSVTKTCMSLDEDSIEAEDIPSQALYNSRILHEQCYEEAWRMYYGIQTFGTERSQPFHGNDFDAEHIPSQTFYNSRILYHPLHEEDWRLHYGVQTSGTETCQSSDEDSIEIDDIPSQVIYNSRITPWQEDENVLKLHRGIGTPNGERNKQSEVDLNHVKKNTSQTYRKLETCQEQFKDTCKTLIDIVVDKKRKSDVDKLENGKETDVLQELTHRVNQDSGHHSMLCRQRKCSIKLNNCDVEENNTCSYLPENKVMLNQNSCRNRKLVLTTKSQCNTMPSKITQSIKDETCKQQDNSKFKNMPDHQTIKKHSREQREFLQSKIDEALIDINEKSCKVLMSHEQRIDKMQSTLDDNNAEDQNVVIQKLTELKLQKSEFVQRRERLIESLKTLDSSTAKQEDVSHLLKSAGIECTRLKNALPIYARRTDIVDHVQSHQVSIILGETGSGKSTQLIQYLYEAGFAKHESIICTQPRRIAAMSLAERVAGEMVESVGGLVAYKAGTSKKSNENTKLFFTTDHSLLNECLKNSELHNYSCIIVDEAHERSIYTDILLGIIKICLQKRPDLKVIITSATIDPEVFIKYFDSGPELRVSGRTFPVALSYNEDGQDDFENYEEKAVSKAVEVHCKEGPGDILVFLTSPVEIMRCCEEFEKRCQDKNNFKCLPLHGQLPPEEQRQVFVTLSDRKRKIIFATNCAETSITVDGVKFVIDTGVAKEMKYDPKRNMNQLGIHAISKSSANQRKGRAGRTASGKCFRLYSQESFQAMKFISDPEILRVHLGQAILKLSELGINIRSYDFVQAPSETALSSAIETLEYLGAIVDNKITDVGRWISKLPFDPKLGYVVYEANKNDLLFDAIVLAAVMSSGSDLFFRGFTESESEVVARTKIFFGSKYGDTFTWLQVYKEWREVQENNRAWCRSRCINYKCISYVNQCIKETNIILSRDLGIDLTQQFSTQTEAMDKLRKILFIANAHSISNFSERVRAGYFSIFPDRQVYLHPSSVLVALNVYPEWLVYTNLVETSREFIKGVTAVEEEWVIELANSGKLYIDIPKAMKNKFYRKHREEVGYRVFRGIVGPQFSNLRILEDKLRTCGLPKLVMEAMRNIGLVDVYSPFPMSRSAIEELEKLKEPIIKELLAEDCEFNLNKKEAMMTSGTCVVIGLGGCVKNIFMPNQSDKVVIKRIDPNVTKEKILSKFQVFGEIKEIVPFKSYDPWGFVRFGSVDEALMAVEKTSNDRYCAGILKLPSRSRNVKNMFEAKLTWIRRPIKGSGTAFIECSKRAEDFLIGRNIRTSVGIYEIKKSKRGGPIIFNTGFLTEDEIDEDVSDLMIRKGREKDMLHLRVSVARERVPLEHPNDIKRKAHRIDSFIKDYLEDDTFEVRMLMPNEGNIYYTCFLSFTDIWKGYTVCKKIERHFGVYFSPVLQTVVQVPKRLKNACDERFETLFNSLENRTDATFSWIEIKEENFIQIHSSEPSTIVMARHLLCKVMEGETIDCSGGEHFKCLLNGVGQDFLRTIERANKCAIMTDFRKSTIHLYGSETNIIKTQQDIFSYMRQIKGSKQKLIHLKGHDKPPGLMKMIMQKYGLHLDGLREEFDLKSINVHWKRHTIQLIGTEDNVTKATQSLAALETEVWKETGREKEANVPDCVVCTCPVENTEELYRLEVCAHAYCFHCMEHQLLFSMSNKDFPITCAGEDCDLQFVWRDIKFALSKKWIREDKLVSMSVNDFVLRNRNKYMFCLTPNCQVVYEVTADQSGCEFNCPLCHASICTTCHNTFHAGLSCTMAKRGGPEDSSLSAWNRDDRTRRKFCPNCQCPIEKTEGCNSMHCPVCQTFFCWLCLKIYSSNFDCKRHISLAHSVRAEVRRSFVQPKLQIYD